MATDSPGASRALRSAWSDVELEHIIKAAELQVPHPHLSARQFVLVPLLEIAPDLLLPDGARVAELADPSSRCVVWHAAAPWPQRHRGERA